MAYNFVSGDRDQLLLMPPSVADWLPAEHLAWFVLDVVDELDLSAFHARYRVDGRGGAAYDPRLLLGVLLYAYSVGERSSRRIEKRLAEDVAYRVIAANQQPDHATIARFRAAHQDAIAGLFGQVLALCSRAGLLRPGLVAIDGTKLVANASMSANRTARQLAEEILAEAAAVDAAEDAEAAAAVDPPDPGLTRRAGRRERLRSLLAELETEASEKSLEVQAQLARRAERETAAGKPLAGRRPNPQSPRHGSRQHANTTDPESRLMKTRNGFVQGYNAQAVATADQFVVAAQVSNQTGDAPAYEPMITATKANLKQAGERRRVRRVLADAGYWSQENVAVTGVDSYIAPGKARQLKTIADNDRERAAVLDQVQAEELSTTQAAEHLGVTRSRISQLLKRRRRGEPATLTSAMIAKLDTPSGRRLYKQRSGTIEPVFAQVKHNRGIRTLSRRGLQAADSEWKLICATHNLLKLHLAT